MNRTTRPRCLERVCRRTTMNRESAPFPRLCGSCGIRELADRIGWDKARQVRALAIKYYDEYDREREYCKEYSCKVLDHPGETVFCIRSHVSEEVMIEIVSAVSRNCRVSEKWQVRASDFASCHELPGPEAESAIRTFASGTIVPSEEYSEISGDLADNLIYDGYGSVHLYADWRPPSGE